MAAILLVNSYMMEKSSFARTCDRMFDLPVFGAMIGLALLVVGYYLSEEGPQEGMPRYTSAVLSPDMLFGRYLYIASGIFFLISVVSYVRDSFSRNKASFIDTGRSLAALEDLSWKEFVDYIIDLYERLGYTLEGASGVRAEGADLKVKREGRFSMVRCKKYYVRKVSLAMVA